jgi:hypothetical protein
LLLIDLLGFDLELTLLSSFGGPLQFGVGMESGLGIIAGRINRGWLAIKLLISWLSGSRPPTTIDR